MKSAIAIMSLLALTGCTTVDSYTKKVADRRHEETQPDPTFQQHLKDSMARGDQWYVTPSGAVVVLRQDSVTVLR